MKQIVFIGVLLSLTGCDAATTSFADSGSWDLAASAENTAFESRQARLKQRDVDDYQHTFLLGLEEDDPRKFRLSYNPSRRQECTLRVVGTAVDVTELGLDWKVNRVELPDSGSTFELHHAIFSTTSRFAYLFGDGEKLALRVAHQCGDSEFERVWVFDIKGADVAMNWLRGAD